MAEYIDRQAAIEKIRDQGIYGSGYSNEEREDDVVDMIESIPAADVRPVLRGRWEYNLGDNIPYCSECMMPQDSECNFCPNCVADMREES